MKEFINNLKRVWKYSKSQKGRLFLYYFCLLINIANGIILPVVAAKIIVLLTNSNFYQIVITGFVIFFIESLQSFTTYSNTILSGHIYRETLGSLETDLGKEVLKLENKSIDDNSSGVFISRFTKDASELSDIFNSLGYHVAEAFKNIGIFIAVFIINKICFVYLLFIAIITFLIDKKRSSERTKNEKQVKMKDEIRTGFIGEMIRGIRDIKMLNSEQSFIKKLELRIKDANEERFRATKINRTIQYIGNIVRDISELGLIILLVYLMSEKHMTPTIALVVYHYSGNTSYVTMIISEFLDSMVDFNVSCSRVFSLIDNKEFKKEKFGNKHLDNVEGNFEFKNVTFSYKEENILLNNLSFKIKANETVAFVGKSGAGKTTIFNLLCKMYPEYQGKITIDGVDLKELDKDSIRSNITIISQSPYIFNVSIKENLQLVKEDVTDEEIKEACQMACLDEFVEGLKDKYDTIVGEGGITLSGGQKQRLAIARALIQKTEIILFDEATSALDNETQDHIQKAIENMKNQYTILIIAHRLSTIINSDRILFLNNGRIEAEGTHKDLLKNCPEYKQLYESEIEKKN